MERVGLAFETVVLSPQPTADLRNVQVEQEGPVGEQPTDGGEVQVEDALEPEVATHALVGDRRVEVAVADDRRAAVERRPDHLLDVLSTRGRVQQRFRPRGDVPAVQDEIAHFLAELRPPRLARGHHLEPVGLEPPAEELRLRRLPRAVEALERDEHGLHPHGAPAATRMRSCGPIVTGGAGFIGSHVVDALVARGDEVAVVDSLVHGKPENVSSGATLHVRDIREPLDDLFDEVRPEAVFHLAAQADVRVSVEDPVGDATTNVLGTVRVLEGARRHGAQVVFASTGGAIYGECESPRARTSRASHCPRTGRRSSQARSTCACTTASTTLGTSPSGTGTSMGRVRIPHGEAGVVAIFLGALARGEQAKIFGDGLQTRDYVYVGDVARATTSPLGQDRGVFNVGTGRETSVVELYELCARVAGSDTKAEHAPARLGELQRSFLDTELAASELGFTAMVGLEDGLRATWEWVLKE